MKAITPVIATVMLMLITVGMVGITYTWFSGMLASNTEKVLTIPVGGVQCYNNRISVIVTNSGANSNITDDDIVVADVNGVNVRNSLFFGNFDLSNIVAYWRFESGLKDFSGNGNDGSVVNGATLINDRFGSAYSFDGNDYILMGSGAPSLAEIAGNKLTIEAWVKPNNLAGTKYNIATKNGPFMFSIEGSVLRGWILANLGWVSVAGNVFLVSGQWNHVAMVYDGANIILYANGVFSGSVPQNGNLAGDGCVLIGVYSDGSCGSALASYFNGVIDEVKIYKRALRPDEISLLSKANSGNFTLAPGGATTMIRNYPVFNKGKYAVRIVTRNGVIEQTVECL